MFDADVEDERDFGKHVRSFKADANKDQADEWSETYSYVARWMVAIQVCVSCWRRQDQSSCNV